MLLYLLLFIYIAFFSICELFVTINYQKKVCVVFMFIPLIVFSGLHGIGGSDFDIYKSAFNRTPFFWDLITYFEDYRKIIFSFEPGYIIFISLIKSLGFDFNGYIVLQTILFYFLFYIGLKRYTKYWGLVLIIFLYKMFFYDTFIAMRQSLTVSGFFYLLKYIYNKQSLKYFIGCFILSTIHYGAILLFLVYFINIFNISKKKTIVLSLIFLPTIILAQLGFGDIINQLMILINPIKGEHYAQREEFLSIFYSIEYYILLLFIIFNFKKLSKLKYGDFMIKIFIIILPFVTLFSGINILRRELDYFFPTYGILGGYLCFVNKQIKLLIATCYIVICLYGYQRYLHNFDDGGLIPYRTWIKTNT